MTEREKRMSVLTASVCAAALLTLAIGAYLRRIVPAVLLECALKSLACLIFVVGVWVCAWECGRRWQAEHGWRKCGAVGEDEAGEKTGGGDGKKSKNASELNPKAKPCCMCGYYASSGRWCSSLGGEVAPGWTGCVLWIPNSADHAARKESHGKE